MDPNSIDIVKTSAALMDAGHVDSAVEEYNRAIACDPSQPLAYIGLAETLGHQRKFEAAVEAAREGVERRPTFGRAHRQLAICLSELASTCTSRTKSDEHM